MARLTTLLLAGVLLSAQCWATLAVDSEMPAQSGANSADGATTLTYSFTNTAGTLLLVGVVVGSGSTIPTITVTYGGVSMTSVVSESFDNNTLGKAQLFRLLSPATGANNVVVTVTNNNGSGAIISGAISFTGNDTTTPVAQTAVANDGGATSTTSSVMINGTTSGNIVVDLSGNGTSMGTSGKTLSWKKNVDANQLNNAASSRAAAGGNVTMSYTGNGNDFWVSVAAEVKAAGGGGGGKTCTLSLMGAGPC